VGETTFNAKAIQDLIIACGSTKQYRSLESQLVKTAGGIERLGRHAQNKVHLISDVFSDLRKTLPEKNLAPMT
jgi:hypothetical protein